MFVDVNMATDKSTSTQAATLTGLADSGYLGQQWHETIDTSTSLFSLQKSQEEHRQTQHEKWIES